MSKHDGRSHMVPWVAACGPGCLIICDAWRKDRRGGKKDKLTQNYLGTLYWIVLFVLLDPLCFCLPSLPLEADA